MASIVLKLFERISYLHVPLFDVASHRASHQFSACAAGLQITGSTVWV
jgi:hypothetical protein